MATPQPMTDCVPGEHDWRFIRDWYGDPNVIHGTADCSIFRCLRCDLEQADEPDDFVPEERYEYEYNDG